MEYLVARLGCAFLAGALLSQAGSLIQLGTRNILASPSTLGVDGLAILWLLCFRSLGLYLGAWSPLWGVFLGLPLFIAFALLYRKFLSGQDRLERIILMGITFNLLIGAIFSLWQFFFLAFNLPFPMEVWFGHFRYADTSSLFTLGLLEVIILISYFSMKKTLVSYSLGPEVSRNLGLNRRGLYTYVFLVSVLATYFVVSFFGAFAFLGLIFPIMARKLWFNSFDLKGEILWGSFLNGLILCTIDAGSFFFPIYGAEMPVGLLMSVVGALSLILLAWRSKSSHLVANQRK